MLVASDDGILDLGVDANVQRCGQHVQDFCTDRSDPCEDNPFRRRNLGNKQEAKRYTTNSI